MRIFSKLQFKYAYFAYFAIKTEDCDIYIPLEQCYSQWQPNAYGNKHVMVLRLSFPLQPTDANNL